jgi:hypothetical protein
MTADKQISQLCLLAIEKAKAVIASIAAGAAAATVPAAIPAQ